MTEMSNLLVHYSNLLANPPRANRGLEVPFSSRYLFTLPQTTNTFKVVGSLLLYNRSRSRNTLRVY